MTDLSEIPVNTEITPQCHYYVVRKKRLCRMTVRPGRQYCGEHEPKPKTEDGTDDTRIPCPYDPKHSCYASKLEKHLSICNAKQTGFPPYIIQNINAPANIDTFVRRPLSEIPKETLMQVIDKVNDLYEKHIKGNISVVSEQPIHPAVMEEFSEGDRTESSRRHMRQASSILHLAEKAGLVNDQTCYVELGAGKGQLSYYMGTAWCDDMTASSVVVVDRAALRHKRDNKLTSGAARLRADLAHLALGLVAEVEDAISVVGFAKHLCGVATDYALRCMTAEGVAARARGLVLATCCHHRCERARYVANAQLQKLGINGDDLNAMLGIVSWATCGDGRSRERRRQLAEQERDNNTDQERDNTNSEGASYQQCNNVSIDSQNGQERENNTDQERDNTNSEGASYQRCNNVSIDSQNGQERYNNTNSTDQERDNTNSEVASSNQRCLGDPKWREEVGRRAKALLDWGRVLYLREKGFDTQLCHYVPATVSPENVCIVATKPGRHWRR